MLLLPLPPWPAADGLCEYSENGKASGLPTAAIMHQLVHETAAEVRRG
jgi:hypothetical protein